MSAAVVIGADVLLATLWQGPLVAAVAWLAEHAWARRASGRHAVRAAALMTMPALMLATGLGSLGRLGSPWDPGLASGTPGPAAPPPIDAAGVEGWMAGWLLGVGLMSARVLVQWRRVLRLRRSSWPLPAAWQHRVRSLARAIGVDRPSIAVSADCETPLLLGVVRPLVLLPVGLLHGVDAAVVEAAVAHELMHWRRFDPWLNAGQIAIEVALFFNPAVWWLSWRMSQEREHACDEAVVAALERPALGYARALVELEAWRQRPAPALTLGLGGAGLRARVLRLVRPPVVGGRGRWAARIGVLALALAGLGWMTRPGASPPAPSVADPLAVSWLPAAVRRHEDAIVGAARRHGVDPGLLAIMVWVESRGRVDARSPVGARGLLQLMPSTAAEIARERGLADHASHRLDEPGYNLDLGAWYLARQLERYERLPLALAAYNAGPGRTTAYLRGESALPRQTRRYQATILSLWWERWLPWSPTLASRSG